MTVRVVQVEDSPEAVNEFFQARGWSDGLPLIPPTRDRVSRMVAASGLEGNCVLGQVPPRGGLATVEAVAVNAVMAGCRPEYTPVVIAAVLAVLRPEFNLAAIQATTHLAAPLIIVHGPIASELGIAAASGCMGPGFVANATIGRTLRLVLLNIGGGRPGEGDMATFGQPAKFTYCTAENDPALPWPSLGVRRGLDPNQSGVTVVAAEGPHNVNDHGSTSPEGMLLTIAGTLATPGLNNLYLDGEVLVVLGPEHAKTIAAGGWSVRQIQEFLFEHARVPLVRIARENLDRFRVARPQWFTQPQGDAVPVVDTPDDFLIAVAGGPGKHSLVIPTFGATRAVTIPIGNVSRKP